MCSWNNFVNGGRLFTGNPGPTLSSRRKLGLALRCFLTSGFLDLGQKSCRQVTAEKVLSTERLAGAGVHSPGRSRQGAQSVCELWRTWPSLGPSTLWILSHAQHYTKAALDNQVHFHPAQDFLYNSHRGNWKLEVFKSLTLDHTAVTKHSQF